MSEQRPLILLTGATGKVGQNFLRLLRERPSWKGAKVRALCHNRVLEEEVYLEVQRGSIEKQNVVEEAMEGVTHVIHLATCKETPADIMDVTVKGLFWLLENARISPTFRQFVLIGGDAAMGHFHYPHPAPVLENQKHTPYPGCYALSKVLEEVMLEQYYVQYDLNGCCLRAPWIMEKDDFRYSLSFGEDVFGGPRWMDLVESEKVYEYLKQGTVPVMLDPDWQPVLRNFIHVEDLVEAILLALDHPKARQQLFNICMDEPVNYRKVAEYLMRTRGLPSVDIMTPFCSTWLDNTKARFLLNWRPQYDLEKLIETSWNYERSTEDLRIIWYPG